MRCEGRAWFRAGFVSGVPVLSTYFLGNAQELPKGWTAETKRVKAGTPQGDVEKEITYYTNSIGMKSVLVPAGEFMMGSSEDEWGREPEEGPLHRVRIGRAFYMAAHEVSQRQYEAVTGQNPAKFRGAERPVESVSWDEAKAFCEKLSAREGVLYRLPMEAEWEYACRAGTQTLFSSGNAISTALANLDLHGDQARKPETARGTTAVGSFPANSWGLHDLHGNVAEWCADWHDPKYYASSPTADPKGPSKGTLRVVRGGSLIDFTESCRSAFRGSSPPDERRPARGFRVVCELEPPKR
jgi:formylglycine-generating enzyme required for sulfatase activity